MTTRRHGKRPREEEEDAEEEEEDLDLDLHESDDGIEEKNYTVLSESDIRRRQEDVIEALSGVLSISYASSSVLLSHHNWCVTEVCESWYVDEPGVRARVGLLETPVEDATLKCRICLENKDMSAAPCGHLFCASCWRTYIGTRVKNDDGLSLRCPDPSCEAAVDRNMVSRLASADDREIYDRRFVRSYVDINNKKKIKWCPAPGCQHAVELEFVPSGGGGGGGSFDVTCACSNRFCWSCTEEAHHPVQCDTVAKWLTKSGDESHNIEWASLNSKPCPKCRAALIRKSRRGCMHMSCPPPCMHEFCWLCLREWSEHGSSSSCNAFEERRRRSLPKSRWMIAKVMLERYTHYFERWSANDASRASALSELARFQTEDKLAILGEKQNVQDCQFVLDAWMVIVECRRVLKWSYVYGYYLPQEEEGNRKVVFFEFLQGVAEARLERLHKLAEVDLRVFIDAEGCCEGFLHFREELVNLTTMTRNYFEKLVRAMEKGCTS
ncbi:putative E3 ubiquitin-protein ligase ARI8 [Acorus gramineus]|uniref:RBR-type E3 ubiquitin transferase n=1 Tax=Acorus gramineus TaxID=55184 RepID=A0AAV9AK50_ACOGR|nr:putative E3 ubiquitin-protein ligase ARI8 [Acorus gramineus]